MSTPELSRALCYILGFQYCEVDEIHKKIYLHPNDVRTWTKENPIYLVSLGCRSIFVKHQAEEARPFFKLWLFDLDTKGYTTTWPLADGTVKELKEKLHSYGLTIKKDKPIKDDYCIMVGKADAIHHINNEF